MAYEQTKVAVSKSQETIRELLQRFGADGFGFGEETVGDVRWAIVTFRANQRAVRMRVPMKLADEREVAEKAQRSRTKTAAELRAELSEQEARRIWRVLAWNIKARMEAVEEGVETFEEAWLAHLLTPEGDTIFERLAVEGHVELPGPLRALPAGS